MAIDIEWDGRSQRYRFKDTKRFASQQQVRALLGDAVSNGRDRLASLADNLLDRTIDLPTFSAKAAEELKQLHSWSWLLGGGGYPQIQPGDRGVLSDAIRSELEYFDQFQRAIAAGELSPAQIKSRLDLYSNGVTKSYHRSSQRSHERAGYISERRHRTRSESCPECISYEGMGWREIGELPVPGDRCSCRSNCGCYKEYSTSKVDRLMPLSQWGSLKKMLPEFVEQSP